jgi:transposase
MKTNVETLKERYKNILPFLTEKQKRIYVGNEANLLGFGGISEVSRHTGVSRRVISEGIKELRNPDEFTFDRIRKGGAGRKLMLESDKTLIADLERLLEPDTRGDPESPLRWTCKSLRNLAEALKAMNHKTSHRMVGKLLHELRYSLQANRKTQEGGTHPDRNAQFEYINDTVKKFHANMQPVISVDAKKKENVGEYKNNGKEWHPKGTPEKVKVYDFEDKELGKVCPYGVYDMGENMGWVSVGIDHDTASFAVESIRRWWNTMGNEIYNSAKELLITADGGGSNSRRSRLWKKEIQKLANETGLKIKVCHFPPGTSKWNKIEHRLFSYISQNWRGKPLVSHEVIVNLIASTKTSKGLKVKCQLDENKYPKGIKVSNEELSAVNISHDSFHGEWNYSIEPINAKT